MVNRTPYRSAHAQTCSVTDAVTDTEGINTDGIIVPGVKGTFVVADPGLGLLGALYSRVNIPYFITVSRDLTVFWLRFTRH